MTHELPPSVTLPADCIPFTSWYDWAEGGSPADGRKFRGVYGRTFGSAFLITTSAIQLDDGSMRHASLDIKSRYHNWAPGCLDAGAATQLAADLEATNELDRLSGWTGE